MRFCLDLDHNAWRRTADAAGAARETVALAAAADAGGIDAIWASEDPDGWDAFGVLGAVAAVTSRARLGTGVVNPLSRHPNLIAASVATLDRLSDGRAVLGLGRGEPEWFARGLGVDAERPLARVAETIRLLRQWEGSGRASSGPGDVFAVDDWRRSIGPVQAHVPVWVAAVGPQALALAGREADGVIFNALTSEAFLGEAIPAVRRAAAGAGRDPDALAFVLRTPVTVADDPAPILRQAKNLLALVNTLPGMGRAVETPGWDVSAILAEVARAMRTEAALAASGGFPAIREHADFAAARALIPDGLVARLAVVGPLPEVRDRLRALAALGVTHVSVAPPPDASPEAWRSLLADLRRDG